MPALCVRHSRRRELGRRRRLGLPVTRAHQDLRDCAGRA
jgi:hypothetical protein